LQVCMPNGDNPEYLHIQTQYDLSYSGGGKQDFGQTASGQSVYQIYVDNVYELEMISVEFGGVFHSTEFVEPLKVSETWSNWKMVDFKTRYNPSFKPTMDRIQPYEKIAPRFRVQALNLPAYEGFLRAHKGLEVGINLPPC